MDQLLAHAYAILIIIPAVTCAAGLLFWRYVVAA